MAIQSKKELCTRPDISAFPVPPLLAGQYLSPAPSSKASLPEIEYNTPSTA